MSDKGFFNDPELLAFAPAITSRYKKTRELEKKIKDQYQGSLRNFANYHQFFGMHMKDHGWMFREWAPNAEEIHIVCDRTGWQKHPDFKLEKKAHHVFEKQFSKDTFFHQDLYKLIVTWPGGEGERIPTAATRVVQDAFTHIFNAQVWQPETPYKWDMTDSLPCPDNLLVYETHVGMALEDGRIGTYGEFEHHILPKVIDAGYNAIQFMAIQEHPFYGSFGYHVSSFFAPTSRFGTPEELKSLVDAAHKAGLVVFMDVIHSHAVNNEVEGIARFDGTHYQFFHEGDRGYHQQWDSMCFDYSKHEVMNFLLSNLKYWIDTFHVDGFRFDGITSMLFKDHGLARAFTSYHDYYNDNVDEDALSYLYLANQLVHETNAHCVTIAEDVSGYPGLAAPTDLGGTGFNFRYAMGIADYWIKLLKEVEDDKWHLGTLWYELTTKRKEEKTISYAESHDQALVGDQTLMMRLMGGSIYQGMEKKNTSIETFRAVCLHKLIRLITMVTAGSGYLNFMGNEFAHPEWIDFPTPRNDFSFHYARRQWSLKYNQNLYFSSLSEFDKKITGLVKSSDLFTHSHIQLVHIHEADKVIAFSRGGFLFIFNFHPEKSYTDYMLDVVPGQYRMVLNSDEDQFGGQSRLDNSQVHFTLFDEENYGKRNMLSLYLPTRTALVLQQHK